MLRLEERALSQSARHRRQQQKYQLTLVSAEKPHTKPVTSLAVDSEGKILASGSMDNTVFFLNVKDQYSPIGFIHTPAPVTTMRWSAGSKVRQIDSDDALLDFQPALYFESLVRFAHVHCTLFSPPRISISLFAVMMEA